MRDRPSEYRQPFQPQTRILFKKPTWLNLYNSRIPVASRTMQPTRGPRITIYRGITASLARYLRTSRRDAAYLKNRKARGCKPSRKDT